VPGPDYVNHLMRRAGDCVVVPVRLAFNHSRNLLRMEG
jgi:hypothetical protein